MPVIMSPDGRMVNGADADARVPATLLDVDRFEARTRIVAQLREAGLLVRIDDHPHAVRHCYRCDTVVEPRLSDQWFVRMQPLAEPALAAVRDGRIRIMPERWEAVYVNWLEGIRDWNISRQLWWGHRIPVYHCDACGAAPKASREPITTCPDCGAPARQDEDVLDTWFSSWLWPISTMGWPDATSRDLKAFYPGDMLVTAPEILFFWVARMIMSGMRFMDGQVPFHTVYLHGTVRDITGRKMSKSLGNGIDPLDVVDRYGADALRWTLVAGMGLGVDVLLDHEDLDKSFAPGRNFGTKLWNIGRFLLTRVGTAPVKRVDAIDASRLTVADHWILERLDAAIRESDAALGPSRPGATGAWTAAERTQGLRLDAYADAARRYVWNELADWYLEAAKPRLAAGGDDAAVVRAVLAHAFDGALRLLQPIIPFVTETLWAQLPPLASGDRGAPFLATAAWPRARDGVATRGDAFATAQAAVVAIRQLRGEYGIAPGTRVAVTIVPAAGTADAVTSVLPVIATLARADVSVAERAPGGTSAQSVLAGGTEVVLPLEGVIDVAKECQRLRDELAQKAKLLEGVRGRLANEGFTARAKPEVVEGARAQERDLAAQVAALTAKVEALCGTR
jgi:valyl-tRNA synthetase